MRSHRPEVEQIAREEFEHEFATVTPPANWLPMPITGPKFTGLPEWLTYRWRQVEHHQANADYLSGWRRPAANTAQQIWDLLSPAFGLKLEDLAPRKSRNWALTPDEETELDVTTQQAFTVLIADTMALGELRQPLTRNRFFGMLCSRWSDHWRAVVEEERAHSVFEMREETVRACARDLTRNRLDVLKLWDLLAIHSRRSTGNNPLFVLDPQEGDGYKIDLHPGRDTEDKRRFNRILSVDTGGYTPPRGRHPILTPEALRKERQRLDDEHRRATAEMVLAAAGADRQAAERRLANAKKKLERPPRQRILAETPYNIVTLGAESEKVLQYMEEAKLLLNTEGFLSSYHDSEVRVADIEDRLKQRFGLSTPAIKALLSTHSRRYMTKKGKAAKTNSRQKMLRRLRTAGGLTTFYPGSHPIFTFTSADEATLREDLRLYDQALWVKTQFARAKKDVDPAEQIVEAAARVGQMLSIGSGFLTPGPMEIQSKFYRTINRRFQATHLHPAAVTSDGFEDDKRATPSIIEEMKRFTEQDYHTSLRLRWFKARGFDGPRSTQGLVHYDVTASQMQITALVAGLTDLERAISNKTFRKDLAAMAYNGGHLAADHPSCEPYSGPDDERLMDVIKTLIMLEPYGRAVHKVVSEQAKDYFTYGPGWREDEPTEEEIEVWAEYLLAKIEEKRAKGQEVEELSAEQARKTARRLLRRESAARHAKTVLNAMPNREGARKFLAACRRTALNAYREDPSAGVSLTDLLDGAVYRWNPMKHTAGQEGKISIRGKVKVSIGVPVINKKTGSPINKAKLRNMAAPALVHSLDAFFAGLVVKGLHGRGVTTFASVHDCWYLPETVRVTGSPFPQDGLVVLQEVLEQATREWFRGLGPVFDDLLRYLGNDEEEIFKPIFKPEAGNRRRRRKTQTYAEYAREIRAVWEARVAGAERDPTLWPKFEVKS